MSDESTKLIALCRSYARPEVETRYLTETAQHFRALGDHIEALCANLAKMTEERDTMTIAAEAFESRLRDAETALADLTMMTEEFETRIRLAADAAHAEGVQDSARLIEEITKRAEAAESALARMKAQGTFADGVGAAAKVADRFAAAEPGYRAANRHAGDEDRASSFGGEAAALCIARGIRALAPPKPAEEPQS